MSVDPEQLARHLGRNVRGLRERRSLTQQQLSKRSGVPRATLANVESGGANPTLSVLVRVADALEVSLEELVAPPRAVLRHYTSDQLKERKRGHMTVRMMLPDPLRGLSLERMSFPEDSRMTGVPHTAGTREYLTCERGQLRLTVSGETLELREGEVAVFRGDQRHGYHNPGPGPAVAYSAVVLAPDDAP